MTDDIDNDGTTLHESGGVVQPTDAQIKAAFESAGMTASLQEEGEGSGAADMQAQVLGSLKCDGACELHEGQVLAVHVTAWGRFNYCETAIQEDKNRGLRVQIASSFETGSTP